MSFGNCTDAANHGVYNIPSTHPSYRPKLDSDSDGLACEDSSHAVATVRPTPSATATTGTGTRVQAGVGDRLPQTGPGEVTAIGAVIVAVGAVIVVAVRRKRRTRFVA